MIWRNIKNQWLEEDPGYSQQYLTGMAGPRMIPVEGEHVLLIDTIIRAVSGKRIAIWIFISQHAVYPDIPWKSVQLMQAKERYAVGDFSPDTIQFAQLRNCFFTTCTGKNLQIKLSVRDRCSCRMDVL